MRTASLGGISGLEVCAKTTVASSSAMKRFRIHDPRRLYPDSVFAPLKVLAGWDSQQCLIRGRKSPAIEPRAALRMTAESRDWQIPQYSVRSSKLSFRASGPRNFMKIVQRQARSYDFNFFDFSTIICDQGFRP
jgi:hypothetical protein